MNIHEDDSASDTDDPGQLDAASGHSRFPDVAEKEITRRENAVMDDEAAVLSRETLATAREDAARLREDAVRLREDAAHQREGDASSREREMRATETTQAGTDDQKQTVCCAGLRRRLPFKAGFQLREPMIGLW